MLLLFYIMGYFDTVNAITVNISVSWKGKVSTKKQTYCHNHSPSLASGWSRCLKLSWREGEGGDWVPHCTRPQSCGVHGQNLG